MDRVELVRGKAAPLDRSDVDTDQIIPAEWLKRVERTGFGEGLFGAWRRDPSFVLNRPERRDAVILVAGSNFGTGSSREHAVWALEDFGFRAIVSPRFGDIFRTNCTKVGLVPAQVSAEDGAALMKAVIDDPELVVEVDVVERVVRAPHAGIEAPFEMDDFTRWRLIEGLDDIGLTLRNESKISEYETRRATWMPHLSR